MGVDKVGVGLCALRVSLRCSYCSYRNLVPTYVQPYIGKDRTDSTSASSISLLYVRTQDINSLQGVNSSPGTVHTASVHASCFLVVWRGCNQYGRTHYTYIRTCS